MRTFIAVAAAALLLGMGQATAHAQERTPESAVQFLNQFFALERPPARLSDGLAKMSSSYEYSLILPDERLVRAEIPAAPGDTGSCTTLITFDDGYDTRIRWTGSTVRLVTFSPPRHSSMALGRPLIEIEEKNARGSVIIWPGSDDQANRLHQAMEFLRVQCDPLNATGF